MMKHTRPKVCSGKDRLSWAEPEKGAVKKCMNNTDITPPPVISAAAKRSSEISLRNVASPWWQEISRLCVSLEPKVFAPYRRVPPLEMTMPAGSIQSFTEKEAIEKGL